MSSPTPVPTPILTPHQQAALQRRQELNVVKKQLVCIVVTISTLFALCPVWLQLYRNACVIALLGYLTSVTFDLMINLNEKWDNAPAVVKYFVPVRLPDIKPPSETVKGLVAKRVDISSEKLRYFFARVRSILRATVDWLFSSMSQGKQVLLKRKGLYADLTLKVRPKALHQDLIPRLLRLDQSGTTG
jgi:hypothetical protein